ncbi:afadin isoform X10 [Agrilus planipennis]|uniref:Afadin isoform X10 n=1 Tax=Agrilus planipennis TaxID=224129 RepID=A0A7F5QWM3_AGRPL|nr:afadin isoform X10 [Agrilus planipennis]
MHGSVVGGGGGGGGSTDRDRRALEREALRNVIAQWNANRLDLFELSEPNEDLEFHGVMRFYFQDSGQKVATKCIRVASDATVEDVIGTLVEKFRPDMRMLSVPSYALYELHEGCPERRMAPDEKPLLVQLNWHVDDREGRFLLKNTDEKTHNSVHDSNASFRRKLSKREKKQLKKQEKLLRMKSENGSAKEKGDGVAEKLYSELPETSFTRSISNPEAVMRRRRQQKLERKLQQFRSKDGGPDTAGGTLKIYGEALCRDVPYKTLLLSIRDTAGSVVREMLDKYGLNKADPSQWCLVQVTSQPGSPDTEYVLDEDECPLSILMNSPNTSSIMFHVRRRPADCAPRKRKKKPGALGATATGSGREPRLEAAPLLVELGPDGSAPSPGDTARSLRLSKDVMEVGSANGIDLQLYGPHIQPRHAVIANTDGLTSITPCHADAHTYVNGQRIHQTTILSHGNLIKFGHSNAYRFLDPSQENRPIRTSGGGADSASVYDRLSGIDRYPRGQDPILPAVLEFPEEPQEQFLARVITHLDVTTPTFRLAPAYTLYLCARYRASTHYRPELTPTERAHKLTLLLQHAAMLIRHTVQDRSTESTSQAFWLANASELLHFLKSDRHVSAFSIQAQDTLADAVQLAFRNLVACLTGELNAVMGNLVSDGSGTGDDHPRDVVNVLGVAMNLLRKCRVNAALTIQLFSQLFHWISARALSAIINNPALCNRSFGVKLFNKLRNLQAWAESQGLELAAECHLAKIVQCAHLLQAPKSTAEELANLSAACFKLNSLQLRALLTQYKAEPGEQVAPPAMLEQAARAAEGVADELARAEGREVRLHEDPAPPLQLLLPDDGFSCDVVQGVPPGLADFLQPLQVSGLCRLATQPTSSGHWTVYMNAPRPPSALSTTQPEIQVIRLHKAGGGMGLSIVAAKGAGQERLGIYIKSVVPGGAADRDGRLAAGDQLLSVDGQSLLGITQEKAAEFLVRTGSVVTLEVAKGGAVYHGLATLLQQPSPTPNRAWDYPHYYHDSEDSLTNTPKFYSRSAPAFKPKSNVFFNSDDSLYKAELTKLVVPRIHVEQAPEISVEVTDFSEPVPKTIEIGTFSAHSVPVREPRSQRSLSLDRTEKCLANYGIFGGSASNLLRVGGKRFNSQYRISSSLQELSSSTSSMSSNIHESNLDLTQIDPNTPIKRWKSPDYVREGHVKVLAKHFEHVMAKRHSFGSSSSFPQLNDDILSKPKSFSAERLDDNKLNDYERREVLKVLYDWSISGSDSKTGIRLCLKKVDKKNSETSLAVNEDESFSTRNKVPCVKFKSESDLSPKITKADINKHSSEKNLTKISDDSFYHECSFDNCIFNKKFRTETVGTNFNSNKTTVPASKSFPPTKKLKGILKVNRDQLFNAHINHKTDRPIGNRRHSDTVPLPFMNHLVRFGSLEKLSQDKSKTWTRSKKFPESYIVRRPKNDKLCTEKLHDDITCKNMSSKGWKSCSDLKSKHHIVRKCCKNAGNTCPLVLRSSLLNADRKFFSCDNINKDSIEESELRLRLASFDRKIGDPCCTLFVPFYFY